MASFVSSKRAYNWCVPRFVLGSKAHEIDRFNSSIEELDALFGGANYVVQDELKLRVNSMRSLAMLHREYQDLVSLIRLVGLWVAEWC